MSISLLSGLWIFSSVLSDFTFMVCCYIPFSLSDISTLTSRWLGRSYSQSCEQFCTVTLLGSIILFCLPWCHRKGGQEVHNHQKTSATFNNRIFWILKVYGLCIVNVVPFWQWYIRGVPSWLSTWWSCLLVMFHSRMTMVWTQLHVFITQIRVV